MILIFSFPMALNNSIVVDLRLLVGSLADDFAVVTNTTAGLFCLLIQKIWFRWLLQEWWGTACFLKGVSTSWTSKIIRNYQRFSITIVMYLRNLTWYLWYRVLSMECHSIVKILKVNKKNLQFFSIHVDCSLKFSNDRQWYFTVWNNREGWHIFWWERLEVAILSSWILTAAMETEWDMKERAIEREKERERIWRGCR